MTTTPNPESLARLPKWARDHIARLERRADDAKRERDEARLQTDPKVSSALLDPWADIPIGLGPDARIRFILGSADRYDWIDVHVVPDSATGRPAIEVRTGGARLAIRSESSNVVLVGLIP